MKTTTLCLIACVTLSCSALAGPAKTYQVTGPILDVNDTTIVVEKEQGKNERWEIARDSSTKADGELKKGDKVTITYVMNATKIEVKAAAKTGDKPAASPAKK